MADTCSRELLWRTKVLSSFARRVGSSVPKKMSKLKSWRAECGKNKKCKEMLIK